MSCFTETSSFHHLLHLSTERSLTHTHTHAHTNTHRHRPPQPQHPKHTDTHNPHHSITANVGRLISTVAAEIFIRLAEGCPVRHGYYQDDYHHTTSHHRYCCHRPPTGASSVSGDKAVGLSSVPFRVPSFGGLTLMPDDIPAAVSGVCHLFSGDVSSVKMAQTHTHLDA